MLFPRSLFPTTVHLVVDLHIITLPSCHQATYLSRFPSQWEITRHIRHAIFTLLY